MLAAFTRFFTAFIASSGCDHHCQLTWENTDQMPNEATAQQLSQFVVPGIIRVGQVAVGDKDFFAVELNASTVRENFAAQSVCKYWSKVEIVVTFNINQLCPLPNHALQNVNQWDVFCNNGVLADPELEYISKQDQSVRFAALFLKE